MTTATETTATESRDKLARDMRVLLADTEELIRATADQTGEKVSALRPKITEGIRRAKDRLIETEHAMANKGRAGVQAGDALVREHPWQAIGIAAAVGAVIGLLLHRK